MTGQILANGNGFYGCITPTRMRRDLENWLDGYLGTYRFQVNGSSKPIPALSILPDPTNGYNYPPEDTKISGLEVRAVSQVTSPYPLLGFGQRKQHNWAIILLLWDNTGNLRKAADALMNGMNLTNDYLYSQPVEMPVSEELGIIAQVKVQVQDNGVSHPTR